MDTFSPVYGHLEPDSVRLSLPLDFLSYFVVRPTGSRTSGRGPLSIRLCKSINSKDVINNSYYYLF
jgi:hypothetical protein